MGYFNSMQRVRFTKGRRQPMPPSQRTRMVEIVNSIWISHLTSDTMALQSLQCTVAKAEGLWHQ